MEFRADHWDSSRGAAFRILRRISLAWDLSDEEERTLWGLSHRAYHATLREHACPSGEGAMRAASLIVRVFFFIGCVWPFDEKVQHTWMRRKNWRCPFYGRTPLAFALHCEGGLRTVCDVLSGMLVDRGGGVLSTTQVIYPDGMLSLSDEDDDILAMMIVRIGRAWDLLPSDWLRMFQVTERRLVAASRQHKALSEDARERIRCALTVHSNYRYLLSEQDALAITYAKEPMRVLGGISPLDLLRTGDLAQMQEIARKSTEDASLYGWRV